jgi:hypothetical protein
MQAHAATGSELDKMRAGNSMDRLYALVQHASGDIHRSLVNETSHLHFDYCERWGAEYILDFTEANDGRTGHWRKIDLLRRALKDGFRKALWIDSDAIIVDPNVNIFDAAGYGVAVCECFDSPTVPRHLNTGVILCTASPQVVSFLDLWDKTPGIGVASWEDQNAFIELMRGRPYRELLTILPNRFNCVETHMEASEPVVRHFAGDPDRMEKMRIVAAEASERYASKLVPE